MKAASPSVSSVGGWKLVCPQADPLRGLGFSSSSNQLVLFSAARSLIMTGPEVGWDPDVVAQEALAGERLSAGGMAVGANDVWPIVEGGLGETCTIPIGGSTPRRNGNGLPIDSTYARVPCDWSTMGLHAVVAADWRAGRHSVPKLLGRVVAHRKAAAFVEQINLLTDDAVAAVRSGSFSDLMETINSYRGVFNQWTEGAFTRPVEEDGRGLVRRFGGKKLGWKPCGAGACKSLIVVVDDPARAQAVIDHLTRIGWDAGPLRITDGLRAEVSESGRRIRLSAGHRVDFIGAADLGQDPRIGVAGRCLACAIEPRTDWILTRAGGGEGSVATFAGASLLVAAADAGGDADEGSAAPAVRRQGRNQVFGSAALRPMRCFGWDGSRR